MDDEAFFAALLEAFKATTHAENSYWEPIKIGDSWNIYAVGADDRTLIAVALEKPDADFICAVHATTPDLVRRLTIAVAEAEKADEARDEREQLIAELILKKGQQ